MIATPKVLSIGEGQKKVYTSAGVLFSKKYSRSAKKRSTRLLVSCFREISAKNKKGVHDCRFPVFIKISVKNKKKSTPLQVSCFRENIGEEQKKGLLDCRCPVFVKIFAKGEKNVLSGICFSLLVVSHYPQKYHILPLGGNLPPGWVPLLQANKGGLLKRCH